MVESLKDLPSVMCHRRTWPRSSWRLSNRRQWISGKRWEQLNTQNNRFTQNYRYSFFDPVYACFIHALLAT
jgi:hypothetical protein